VRRKHSADTRDGRLQFARRGVRRLDETSQTHRPVERERGHEGTEVPHHGILSVAVWSSTTYRPVVRARDGSPVNGRGRCSFVSAGVSSGPWATATSRSLEHALNAGRWPGATAAAPVRSSHTLQSPRGPGPHDGGPDAASFTACASRLDPDAPDAREAQESSLDLPDVQFDRPCNTLPTRRVRLREVQEQPDCIFNFRPGDVGAHERIPPYAQAIEMPVTLEF
jgi:hypothetical protein